MSLCPHNINLKHSRCERCEEVAEAEHRARCRETDIRPPRPRLRPVGHVNELLHDLALWRERRAAKNLDIESLDKAIAYLTEYRDLLASVVNLP